MGAGMSTLGGWVAIITVASAFGYREWRHNMRRQLAAQRAVAQRPARQERERPNAPTRRDPRENRARRAARPEDASAANPTARATGAAPTPAATHRAVEYVDSTDDDKDDAASNREFARQLSSVKQGTKITSKAKTETRQKSVKQSRVEERPFHSDNSAVSATSPPSSTAGIDADDDRSSAASPLLVATEAGLVDDMLEKKAPGPSVLRLTGTEEKKPAFQKKAKASPEPAETKKQRQNRKKAELAKAEREEAEKERKLKLEAQRRVARQAEGRAAKDGSAFMAAQAKQSNAWKSNGNTNGANGKPASSTNGFASVLPLDTFDANSMPTNGSKSSVQSFDKNDDWMSSLPSEEEQMEMLKQETDTWNTVTGKTRKAKAKDTAVDTTSSGVANKTTATAPKPVESTAAKDAKRPTKIAKESSFAALSTAVDGEEEWDV